MANHTVVRKPNEGKIVLKDNILRLEGIQLNTEDGQWLSTNDIIASEAIQLKSEGHLLVSIEAKGSSSGTQEL